MKNKKIMVVLAVLFILSSILAVIGYLNKDKEFEVKPNNTEVTQNYKTIEVTPGDVGVTKLNDLISNYEFTKANSFFSGDGISTKITPDGIEVEIENDFLNIEDENNKTTKYEIKDLKNIVACQGIIFESEGFKVNIYALDKDNNFFIATFFADPEFNHEVGIYKVNVFAESFGIFKNGLNDQDGEFKYVIIKSDNKYYTDYPFEEEYQIKEITNFEEVVEETVE